MLPRVVAALALLGPGVPGLSALFVQLRWSNKSKKYVFIGFVVCLSLIMFLCVLAGLFCSSDWQNHRLSSCTALPGCLC